MIRAVQTYGSELVDMVGTGWNEFWFTPRPGANLFLLRRLATLFALLWLLSFTSQLAAMFGADGWMSLEVVHQTTAAGDLNQSAPGFSHLFLGESAAILWGGHAVAIVVVLFAVFSVRPRWTVPMTLFVVLCYVHRGPMMTTVFERCYACYCSIFRLALRLARKRRSRTG